MIELLESDLYTANRKSSKGNQFKWRKGDLWVKADAMGYEGLAEYVVSHLLSFSNLNPGEFVLYDTERIRYKRTEMLGCVCRNFLKDGQQLITLERLYQTVKKASLQRNVMAMPEQERFRFLIEQISYVSGVRNLGEYLAKMLTADVLFLNEDRHFHNIALIEDHHRYSLSPIFDNGAALLSDTKLDYPMGENLDLLISGCKSKTLHRDFETQLEMVEALYGNPLRFTFRRTDVEKILLDEPYYPNAVKERVYDIVMAQRRKYRYLFESAQP